MSDTTEARPTVAAIGSYPDLAGKVAVVTGGSRGIGAATAAAFAANGAAVAVVGRDEAALAAVTADIAARGGPRDLGGRRLHGACRSRQDGRHRVGRAGTGRHPGGLRRRERHAGAN